MGVCQPDLTAAAQLPVAQHTSVDHNHVLQQKAETFWDEIKDLKIPDVTTGKRLRDKKTYSWFDYCIALPRMLRISSTVLAKFH